MSASAFEEFANLLPEALLLVSGDGILRAANIAAVEFFGLAVGEVVGQPLARFTLDDASVVADFLRTSSRSKRLVPGRLTIVRPNGGSVDCRCDGAVYRPRTAEMPALVLLRISRKETAVNQFVLLNQRIDNLSREVAGRRSAESALRAVTERLRVTLASIGDAVIATDAEGLVTFMNGVAERLTGTLSSKALGRHLDEVFVIANEETREPVESPVSKVMRQGEIVGLANHTVLIRGDGTELPIDDSGAPIKDVNGSIVGVVLVFHDISERHMLERELLTKTQRLQDADRRKDEFLSMLAHELRNPLAPLNTSVHLLEKLHGSLPEVSRLSKVMATQLVHMTRLVDDLLDVARLTRGAIELHRSPVSLAEVLEQATEMSVRVIEKRGVTLSIDPGATDALIDGDLTRLVQVFTNLLTNAAKFTESGGTVHLSTRAEPGQAVIVVRDTGAGIDEVLLPHIFDLFVQGDRSLDRAQGGLGIGLTVVRAIVQMHGGSIDAHSEGAGRGSEFIVRLPLLSRDGSVHDRSESPDAPAAASSRLRVLVVDDNVDAADSLCSILESWGHDTHSAYSAQAAIDLLPLVRPQAVLLDIGLPGMDGHQLAKAIRLRTGSKLLMVAVTGYGDANSRQRSEEAGIDRHMTKPVDLGTLQTLLSAHAPDLDQTG